MAGTLVIDNLKASSGVLATQNGMTGIAKAWVSFNGSTAAINGSFNVASVVKNGTGDYTINYTTAMANANYCVNCCGDFDGVNLNTITTTPLVVTASSVRVRGHAMNGNIAYDTLQNWVSINA